MKILKELDKFIHLRPNCLLTRKPVLVVSSTTVYVWSWFRKRIFDWHIRRHGYLTHWPTPSIEMIKMHPEKFVSFHVLDIDQLDFNNCIDQLILCAEKDYLDGL